jgi:hypothetical protein
MGLIQSLMEKLQPAGTKEENKKKYFEVLVEALDDGVLTNDEIEELDALRKQLRLSQEDVAGMKLRAFQAAVNAAAADGIVTPKEEKDLEKIKAYLGIQESEIGRNKGTLNKMRMLYEIHKGNLPIIEIAGLGLEFGETAHLEESAQAFEDPGGVVRPNATLSFKAGQPYRMGAGRPQPLPEGLTPVANGTLVVSNQRAIFNTGVRGKNFGMKFDRMTQVLVFTDGFGFVPDNAAPRYLRVENKQEIELIAGIISRRLNPPPPAPEKPAGPQSGPRKPAR